MEIQTVGTVTEKSESPESQPPTTSRKRVRRWHHRGFTGCSTCRRRHVRCDEASPICNNCTRLALECDGSQGRMTFKVYGPQRQEPTKPPKARRNKPASPDSSGESSTGTILAKQEDQEDSWQAVVVSPTAVPQQSYPQSQPICFRFQEPVSPATLANMQCTDERYYTHFIDQVSTLLIIYDNPINANPYRKYFPDFSRSSPSMVGAMQALGALHMANTSVGPQRNKHFQKAMGKYGQVVQMFRARYVAPKRQLGMTDFATCLLLCLFEVRFTTRGNSIDGELTFVADDGFSALELGCTPQRSTRDL
jgi:Fungal Zn(2)-Cys(6) binuclear cluster domain.